MAHLALYREFRPQCFADVVGQQHITRTLRNALMHNRIHHAYLLSGPRGTGKTTVARLLAKAVNCLDLNAGEPCNRCAACQSILTGVTMDVIEIDAASNRGIDEIRDLRDKVRYAPADLKYKVYIIDEVHMLSEQAFNALLKTLEEPPGHVLFVLATTEKQKLPVTIISRCQAFEYHRLSTREIIVRLQEVCQKYGLTAGHDALTAMARQAEGGMRDALSLLDQVMAYAVDGQITLGDTLHVLGSAPLDEFLKLDRNLAADEIGGALVLLDELVRQGKDLRQFLRDYLTHMRDLLLVKIDATGVVLDLPGPELEAVRLQASKLDQSQILSGIRLLSQVESDLRLAVSPRLLVEVGLIRLAGIFGGRIVAQGPCESVGISVSPPGGFAQPPVTAVAAKATTKATAKATKPQQPSVRESEAAEPEGPVASTKAIAAREALVEADTVPEAPPRSVPIAESSPSVTSVGEGVERVTAVWEQVLDLVKRARPSTHMLLAQTHVGRLRGKSIILIAPNAAFAELLKRPSDKAILEKALVKLGLDFDVQAVGPDDPGARIDASSGPGVGSPPAGDRSLLEMAQRVFPKDLIEEINEEG